jgi:hypothetical protein
MPLTLVAPRKGHPHWQIRGSYLHVKRLYRTTGTADKRLAKRLLRQLEREIEGGALDQGGSEKTFSSAALAYVRSGRERRSIKRLSDYFGDTRLSEINQEAIDKAAAVLYPDGDPATRNRHVHTPISAILKHVGIQTRFKRPKGGHGKVRLHWLKIEKLHRLFDAAYGLNPDSARYASIYFISAAD